MIKEKSIAEIKDLLSGLEVSTELMDSLRRDHRKGVQQLFNRYSKQMEVDESERARFSRMLDFDLNNLHEHHILAGVDEAGRGPLAGPVIAAAVILPYSQKIPYQINDSKQMTPSQRESVFSEILDCLFDYGVGIVEPDIIDKINIYQATILAMRKAIGSLKHKPDKVLIDGLSIPSLDILNRKVIKGDQKSAAVAAASIIAKVTRDRLMREYAKVYPEYGFDKHFGYPTKAHREVIINVGVTPIHRRTFSGVKECI